MNREDMPRKVTVGYVVQIYDPDKEEFVNQEFIDGEITWENVDGECLDDPPPGDPCLLTNMQQPLCEVQKYRRDQGIWSEYPMHPRENWKYHVTRGETNLGYWEWVEHQIEED